ncbi:hypothetical protein FHW92_003192 [Novosphingobium sp. SG707]|nr:hypothetical protein [Novosphingobium sp. SG707]
MRYIDCARLITVSAPGCIGPQSFPTDSAEEFFVGEEGKENARDSSLALPLLSALRHGFGQWVSDAASKQESLRRC